MKPLRGWEFDELEEKSAATKKPNSYSEFDIKKTRIYYLNKRQDRNSTQRIDHIRIAIRR
jgi:hypothetical protein